MLLIILPFTIYTRPLTVQVHHCNKFCCIVAILTIFIAIPIVASLSNLYIVAMVTTCYRGCYLGVYASVSPTFQCSHKNSSSRSPVEIRGLLDKQT
jgi:hypothetical protein